jgi:hypothetical protein
MRLGALASFLACTIWAAGIENGGFEDGLAGWTVMHAGKEDPQASYTVVADKPHAGANCLVYRKATGASQNTHVDQTVAVQPHTKYLVSAWVRADGKLTPLLSVATQGRVAAGPALLRSGRPAADPGDLVRWLERASLSEFPRRKRVGRCRCAAGHAG